VGHNKIISGELHISFRTKYELVLIIFFSIQSYVFLI